MDHHMERCRLYGFIDFKTLTNFPNIEGTIFANLLLDVVSCSGVIPSLSLSKTHTHTLFLLPLVDFALTLFLHFSLCLSFSLSLCFNSRHNKFWLRAGYSRVLSVVTQLLPGNHHRVLFRRLTCLLSYYTALGIVQVLSCPPPTERCPPPTSTSSRLWNWMGKRWDYVTSVMCSPSFRVCGSTFFVCDFSWCRKLCSGHMC